MTQCAEVWGESRVSGLIRWPRMKPQILEGKRKNRNGCVGVLRNWQRSLKLRERPLKEAEQVISGPVTHFLPHPTSVPK